MKDSDQYSVAARRKIVNMVLSGAMSKEQARQVYGIKSKSAILEWMRDIAGLPRKAVVDPIPILKNMPEENDDIQKLKEQIKQLEEQLKLSQLKGKAYQIMVDIAKEDFGLDLEKKSGAKQLKDSKKKNRK